MRIGTHNGPFHADETLAIAILLALVPAAEVVRTRDAAKLADCSVVVDVGGVYDVNACRFDHHQIEGKPADRENGIPFSSAGLVWKHFGRDMVSCVEVQNLVDAKLFQAIDALDNGVGTRNITEGVEHATFSDMISGFNPTWLEPSAPADFDAAFMKAVEHATVTLRRVIAECEAEFAAADLVLNQKTSVVVIQKYAPVMDNIVRHLPDARFLVYPSPGGEWMVQCVPTKVGGFDQRKPLPESWADKRGADLDAVTGESGGVFCHKFRFIAGAHTKEQAINLAYLALESA
jgi:uncharacterized UPF0160 family protein